MDERSRRSLALLPSFNKHQTCITQAVPDAALGAENTATQTKLTELTFEW